MSSRSLRDLEPETLRAEVVETVRQRWVRPQPAARRHRVAADQLDKLTRATLDAMLTRRFRISKLPSNEEYDQLFSRVRHWVKRGRAIQVLLGYSPIKNLKTARYSRADWSEFFALCQLCAWHNKVQAVYPPGLRIKIIFDDSTVGMANRPQRRHMRSYMSSVARLISAMDYQSFIVGTMRQSSFAWLFHFGPYQLARRRVRRWEEDPANRVALEQMTEFARRNLQLPPGLDPQEQQRRYLDASHRYRVYWEALQLSGFSRLGNRLIAMYLDGSQHHIRQLGALHLATVGKEQVTQPWQGEGALSDNGHGKLIPLVLTASRRERMTFREVDGLDLIPLEGLDRIEVCWEEADQTASGPLAGGPAADRTGPMNPPR